MAIVSNRVVVRRAALLLIVLFLMGLGSSGCTTLRRKFVRKSKTENTKEIVPILQPEEYRPATISALDNYRTQYAVLRGYFGDMRDVLGKKESDKRERYVLAQIKAKIETMAGLLKDDRQTEMRKLLAKVADSEKELDKARGLRRYDLLSSNLKAVEDGIRRGFNPKTIESSLK